MSGVSVTKNMEIMVDMPEEMVAYLNQLSTKAQEGGNNNIGISEIISTTIRVLLMENEIDISDIQNEDELTRRILGSSKKEMNRRL